MPLLSVQFLPFECSFRQRFCQIIGFWPKVAGWSPRLGTLGSTNSFTAELYLQWRSTQHILSSPLWHPSWWVCVLYGTKMSGFLPDLFSCTCKYCYFRLQVKEIMNSPSQCVGSQNIYVLHVSKLDKDRLKD